MRFFLISMQRFLSSLLSVTILLVSGGVSYALQTTANFQLSRSQIDLNAGGSATTSSFQLRSNITGMQHYGNTTNYQLRPFIVQAEDDTDTSDTTTTTPVNTTTTIATNVSTGGGGGSNIRNYRVDRTTGEVAFRYEGTQTFATEEDVLAYEQEAFLVAQRQSEDEESFFAAASETSGEQPFPTPPGWVIPVLNTEAPETEIVNTVVPKEDVSQDILEEVVEEQPFPTPQEVIVPALSASVISPASIKVVDSFIPVALPEKQLAISEDIQFIELDTDTFLFSSVPDLVNDSQQKTDQLFPLVEDPFIGLSLDPENTEDYLISFMSLVEADLDDFDQTLDYDLSITEEPSNFSVAPDLSSEPAISVHFDSKRIATQSNEEIDTCALDTSQSLFDSIVFQIKGFLSAFFQPFRLLFDIDLPVFSSKEGCFQRSSTNAPEFIWLFFFFL